MEVMIGLWVAMLLGALVAFYFVRSEKRPAAR